MAEIGTCARSGTYVVRPDDFVGLRPKLAVSVGDKVRCGSVLCYDKDNPLIKVCSPASGTISDIVRGAKRRITEIVVAADVAQEYEDFSHAKAAVEAEDVRKVLLDSGLWMFIRQRPFGIVADPQVVPRDIFISFFDTAPLSADFDFILSGCRTEINVALQRLSTLTNGKLWLNFEERSPLSALIDGSSRYEINYFSGRHPAGLVGTHINKLKPINKGETVWTVNACDLPLIGRLFTTGRFMPQRTVAIAGSEIDRPCYYNVDIGSDLSAIIGSKATGNNHRVISGNVLTGRNITARQCLGFFDTCVSVIPEGNKYGFLGWLRPGIRKFSGHNCFVSGFLPMSNFVVDTNYHGEVRNYVVTGEYEKVCPLNIYPQQLIKAILAKDIDKMELLGIYEVVEEDLSLCEFVCSSKIEVQSILRAGLDFLLSETR